MTKCIVLCLLLLLMSGCAFTMEFRRSEVSREVPNTQATDRDTEVNAFRKDVEGAFRNLTGRITATERNILTLEKTKQAKKKDNGP